LTSQPACHLTSGDCRMFV